MGISAENDHYRGAFAAFAGFSAIWRAKSSKNAGLFNFTE